MKFAFDDQTVMACAGMTINIRPHTWHDVTCEKGGKLITVFTSGGFDRYQKDLASLPSEQLADAASLPAFAEMYDTWTRSGCPFAPQLQASAASGHHASRLGGDVGAAP